MEEKELQQPVSSGNAFLHELFKEGLDSSIIPQRPRSRTRTIMKQKGKVPVKEHVEKPMSKAKESQRMLQWMKIDSNKFKWARQADLESLFNL
jgi:hypothetical protein